MFDLTLCDKCNQPVDQANNAVRLQAQILEDLGRPRDALFFQATAQARHLLPVEGCEGSPSRAQYLEGQARDPRPQYEYSESVEATVRAAYEKITATPVKR